MTIITCLAVRVEELRDGTFKYFSHERSVPKQWSSLTQKEKEVVSDFVSKTEKETQHKTVTLCTQSKHTI